jgi:ribonuclease I
VRPLRPGRKNFIALFVVFVALGTAWISQRNGSQRGANDDASSPPPAPVQEAERKPEIHVGFETEPDRGQKRNAGERASFDFYLLALSSHAAFCADGHSRKKECRGDSPPISIHGLWPERLEPRTYPHDCKGPPLDLDTDLARRLAPLMPGMSDGLHEHEWREHGTCSGLDDDEYFGLMLLMASHVDTALGAHLTTLAGGRTSATALREYAEKQQRGMAATLTFHCRTIRDAPPEHRREPYLMEIRQCVDDGREGRLFAPISCATVNRRDQGCGSGFRIAP